MSTTARRIKSEEATVLIAELTALVGRFHKWIVPAGSYSRQKMWLGDIEIVTEPSFGPLTFVPEGEMFEVTQEGVNLHFDRVLGLLEEGVFSKRPDESGQTACGQRHQRLLYKDAAVDFFCVLPPAEWGVVLLLRTGPAELNRYLVTRRMPRGVVMDAGAFWHGERNEKREVVNRGSKISTPTEESAFAVFGLDYIEPERRDSYIDHLVAEGLWSPKHG